MSSAVAWASGSKGTVLRTVDGGSTWESHAVTGGEALDFRAIRAFSPDSAFVMSVGSGQLSRIYKTTDAGGHWTLVLQNPEENGFFDAIAFWDTRRGLVMGDQVNGRIYVALTSDGGASWQAIGPDQMPGAREGEGGFAASGTTAMVAPGGRAWFVTGGTGGGRVFRSTDWGRTWQVAQTPVAHDSAASGIFSIAFRDRLHGVVVGGDYSKPSESRANAAVSADGGATWTAPGGPLPHGYRSAVFFFPGTDHAVAVGTSGTDLSMDGGQSWSAADTGSYNALNFAAAATGWAVGPKGAIARWTGPR